MAARKGSRRKRASSVGKTVESGVAELKKSVDSLRKLLEGYLPSGSRGRSAAKKSRRRVGRAPKRTTTRRGKRNARLA
jgi:hypothetical protein